MSNKQPNVLLITADHWSGRLANRPGGSGALAPTIQQLAAGGVAFENAYSACPVCVPARRTLMTGLSARGHGLRKNQELPMPDAPTMAQCFRNGGYQTYAVGKLHVSPQRNRIGFDDVLACEEGRHPPQMPDDWQMHLSEKGFCGMEYAAGGTQNDYLVTPWHLPDSCHATNWSAREMSRAIHRRDRGRPAFWYLSFIAPHPPLWPLQTFLDLYRQMTISSPVRGSWLDELGDRLPPILQSKIHGLATSGASADYVEWVRKAFFAMATHIDHQIRAVLGTLREEGLAEETIVAFTSDHGDMLGQHNMWGKCVFYEDSSRIPFIVSAPSSMDIGPRGRVDDRLVELSDMMPTLLDLCGLPVPENLEGRSVFSGPTRSEIFGEYGDGVGATRMLRQGKHKLIYYPAGNVFQLFDLESDPEETINLFGTSGMEPLTQELCGRLASHLHGADREWVVDGVWSGLPEAKKKNKASLGCSGQRGYRF